ncbi:Universal stress protein family protein [Variovorax sp. HW608]|nr:Universal stress protein family protein [Variovorax sp. HW608]
MYQRILVPVDGSPVSQHGLEEAIRLAQLTHGRLRLVHEAVRIHQPTGALSIE